MGVCQSRADPFAFTPICSECMVALCYDISAEDYADSKEFWDDWCCMDCNPDYKGSLKLWNLNKGR